MRFYTGMVQSSTKFSPLEIALLRELQTQLRTDAADLLARQLQRVNLVQRHANGREVCCYSLERGAVSRDPRLQFPADGLEVQLATITFSCPSSERNWVAKFFLVQGFFFSILFDAPPGEILRCDAPRIERVQINCDPMQEGTLGADARRVAVNPQLPSWISQVSNSISEVYEPLNNDSRNRLLQQLDVKLPEDYIELIERCDGLTVGDWTVLGLTQIYAIHQPQGDYYLLAELHGFGVLTVDPRDGLLYYFSYDESDPLPVGKQFSQALLTVQRLSIPG